MQYSTNFWYFFPLLPIIYIGAGTLWGYIFVKRAVSLYPNGAIVYIIRIQFMYFIGIIFRLDYISRGLNFASKILTKFAKLNPKN